LSFAFPGIATPSARNDTLQGNPKPKALNPKQIPISKFKAQNPFGHLDFGHLRLFSISDLGFRICFPRDCHATLATTGKKGQFKNVVAQFIGQLCLINQATTKCGRR